MGELKIKAFYFKYPNSDRNSIMIIYSALGFYAYLQLKTLVI